MSEGFIRAGFTPVAHVESNRAACLTLRTRAAYHWTKAQGQLNAYQDYLDGKTTRSELYGLVPKEQISSVINAEIKSETLPGIFKTIDSLLNGASLGPDHWRSSLPGILACWPFQRQEWHGR